MTSKPDLELLRGPVEPPPPLNFYEALARDLSAAGYSTSGFEDHRTFHRTCVCSRKGGTSFWVSRMPDGWYLGTWGGQIYHLPDERRLVELCLSWLARVPGETRSDFDDQLKSEFGLLQVPFDRNLGPVSRG